MKYKVSITGENEAEKISINDGETITKVDFKIYQSDKSASDRSETLFNTVTIQGILTDKSQEQTLKILEWSKKTDKANVYKTLYIEVFNQQEKIRDYYLKDMFCTSYQEIFNEYQDETGDGEKANNSIGMFILEMKQRKGSIDTIKVACR